VELEKGGRPTITICTDLFEPLARNTSKNLGIVDLCIITIPHPLGGLNQEEVILRAKTAAEKILKYVSD